MAKVTCVRKVDFHEKDHFGGITTDGNANFVIKFVRYLVKLRTFGVQNSLDPVAVAYRNDYVLQLVKVSPAAQG